MLFKKLICKEEIIFRRVKKVDNKDVCSVYNCNFYREGVQFCRTYIGNLCFKTINGVNYTYMPKRTCL